jgi:hypothetical protein
MMSENRTSEFAAKVVETGEVWGLESPGEGWLCSDSREYEDVDVLVFWSSKGGAAAHATGDFAAYEPSMIALHEFMEQWLPGLGEDNHLVGLDWIQEGGETDGEEIEAEDVYEAIEAETNAAN